MLTTLLRAPIAEFRRVHREAVTAAGAALVRLAKSCGLIRGSPPGGANQFRGGSFTRCSLVPHPISRELWLPRIAVVRSRPPRFHSHREVAVPRPSEPPADSRCELRRRSLGKN